MVRLHPVLIARAPNCPLRHCWTKAASVKTATHRAAEAIEAAETLFADEMGATLDLSRAAKAVLMATIAAAIEAAIAEEHERLLCAQQSSPSYVR
jgi:hypothetical protein